MPSISELRTSVDKIGSFGVVVPAEYEFQTAISRFKAAKGQRFANWNPECSDPNFPKPSRVLAPGMNFDVDMLAIKPRHVISTLDCLKIIRSYGGVLVGAQGLALAFMQGEACMFPKWLRSHRVCISNDKRSALPKIDGITMVPCLSKSRCWFSWDMKSFDEDQFDLSVILCFRPGNRVAAKL